ncbi:uncharacterized protein MONBRDRAFT_27567 [Monosiga brevicollis MX1]|uniref:Ras-GAP domain-containing protein n=1 Tax=Monosiga brevicollis TaxID=81824 RepID=A9V5N3_MONBE|nr:uncharacterized protein MONBRDRAFT_27567 [Monosiga brevicollis MX1]EDQ87071.1 predicted protein [Monosiga brevicollis MX1]|eukprot:XP_001748014.1 hypothetical protein [Monosiga brevicollis MX1]
MDSISLGQPQARPIWRDLAATSRYTFMGLMCVVRAPQSLLATHASDCTRFLAPQSEGSQRKMVLQLDGFDHNESVVDGEAHEHQAQPQQSDLDDGVDLDGLPDFADDRPRRNMVPKRLSDAFNLELSEDFLMYLNITSEDVAAAALEDDAWRSDAHDAPPTPAQALAAMTTSSPEQNKFVAQEQLHPVSQARRREVSSSRSAPEQGDEVPESDDDEQTAEEDDASESPNSRERTKSMPNLDRERIRRTSSIMRSKTLSTADAGPMRKLLHGSGTQEHLASLLSITANKRRTTIIAVDADFSLPQLAEATTPTSPRSTNRLSTSSHVELPGARVARSSSHDDDEICEGDLTSFFKARRELKMFRRKLAEQCDINYRLERNLRTLDESIGLLIRHRISVEDIDSRLLTYDFRIYNSKLMSSRKEQQYGILFYLLQNEAAYIATLSRQLSLSEIDDFLQTVMFTLFGNFEPKEEHMLLSVFQHAFKLEFAAAKDINSVMRNNSAMSRMITTYTRRGLGQQYLKDVLARQVGLVFELKGLGLDLEPVKIYNELAKEHGLPEGVTDPVTALKAAPVQEVLEERSRALRELTARFVSAIVEDVEAVPYGLRWLCKAIRAECLQRFPDSSQEVLVSLLGGFMMLRYINPAIISPEAFALIHRKPTNLIRRNLTQIAKVLQAITNGTKSVTGSLAILQDFIREQRSRLGRFLLQLCEVEDFDHEYQMERLSALASLSNSISITPNEIYTVHSLLWKYQSQLQLDKSSPLGAVLQQLGEPPTKISRENNLLMELALSSPVEYSTRRGSGGSAASSQVPLEMQSITVKQLRLLKLELEKTKAAFESVCEIYAILTEKIEAYQDYLENVRGQAISGSSWATEFVSVGKVQLKRRSMMARRYPQHEMLPKGLGPYQFKLTKLDKERIITWSNDAVIPRESDPGRNNIILVYSMPTIGHVVLSLRPKGRQALFHTECKLEDLLTKTEDERPRMRLGNVLELDARRMLVLLDKTTFRL